MLDSEKLINSLKALEKQLREHSNAAKFSDNWSYQAPPLNKDDLADLTEAVTLKLEALDWPDDDPARKNWFDTHADKVQYVTQQAVPNLFGAVTAHQAIILLLYTLEIDIGRFASVTDLRGVLTLPINLSKDVSNAKRRLIAATSGVDDLEHKVQIIKSAYEAAANLPATQHDLEQAIKDVAKAKKDAQEHEFTAKSSASATLQHQKDLDALLNEANGVLAKVNAAYRAATSQGLAQAFSSKERALNDSMLLWVLGLLASLAAAGFIGQDRFPQLLQAVSGKPEWGVVLANVVLAAFSLAAPVWFAWVSTKQIGQRFRLSEDYAYKAALASAYEGYRSEAAQLSKELEAQLFAIALGRLDEIPLRLVEANIAGSPMHELFKSVEFKQAVDEVPGFLDRVLAVLKRSPRDKPTKKVDTVLPIEE